MLPHTSKHQSATSCPPKQQARRRTPAEVMSSSRAQLAATQPAAEMNRTGSWGVKNRGNNTESVLTLRAHGGRLIDYDEHCLHQLFFCCLLFFGLGARHCAPLLVAASI